MHLPRLVGMFVKYCKVCITKPRTSDDDKKIPFFSFIAQVVVIFIICVVSLLFVYMLFLLCLDPLIQRRPPHYTEHTDEEVNLVTNRATAFLTFPLTFLNYTQSGPFVTYCLAVKI